MLRSRTPIPHDPGYEPSGGYQPAEAPPPPRGRVRPEARHIARLHTSGSIGMLLEHHKAPDVQKSWLSPPKKDFARLNIRHLRQLQLDTKRKKEECDKPAVRSSHSKYDHIAAKVTAHMGGSHAPPCKETSPGSGESHRKSPRVEERPLSDERGSKNFLAENIRHAAQHATKQPPAMRGFQDMKDRQERRLAGHQRGEVPSYLKERQNQWKQEEEERLASMPDPSIPPGHTLMPTDERLKTLKVLREHQESLTRELQSLPIRTDTLRAQMRRGQLDSKLVEIEDAIKIFSRPKVFIKLDD